MILKFRKASGSYGNHYKPFSDLLHNGTERFDKDLSPVSIHSESSLHAGHPLLYS